MYRTVRVPILHAETDPSRMALAGIYCISNRRTGWVYVGQTVHFRRRWTRHYRMLNERRCHNVALQAAWDQDGPSGFLFEILEVTTPDKPTLYRAEREWLGHCHDHSYNGCPDHGCPCRPI